MCIYVGLEGCAEKLRNYFFDLIIYYGCSASAKHRWENDRDGPVSYGAETYILSNFLLEFSNANVSVILVA